MLAIYLYKRTSISRYMYRGNKGHTGGVLVSRCGCLSSVILALHFLQTTSAYTPDLESLAV